MFLIEQLSNKIGNKIANNLELDRDTEEIITYGAFAVLQTIWAFLCIIILGAICNVLVESVIIALTAATYRKYSGGIHANTPNKCAFLGAIIFVGFALIVKNINISVNLFSVLISILAFVYSYYAIYKFVPVDTKAKPIENEDEILKLRRYSFFIISILFFIEVLLSLFYFKYKNEMLVYYAKCIIAGILWQSFTLTPLAKRVLANIVME
ncbi:accessory gene regulator ArgB-like protein [Clostridium botulinum]|uniref:accessory gene regulator ArgB-like protein n=1 Tax=Clostridium botulinum TaxID=1491 RepID=UPI000947458F|nr:accessory gene regulator B family protein [Clostridium botulinum]APQ97376.1 accessory regulator [Clostridium botulinum]MBN3362674.1 accessory regulator AgrB [Clostridium botulinum]